MNRNKFKAFTLAEVMTVVAIIGVVATLVIPPFVRNTSEKIHSDRQANIAQKVTKAVELMIVNGEYYAIHNTEQFVDRLSKYLKITKRCDSEHLTDCWPTRFVKTALGDEIDVSSAKTGADIYFGGANNDTPNVGLVLNDGASLILSFNPNATPILLEDGFTGIPKDLPVGKGKKRQYAYTSTATNAIDFIMDVNGGSGPNQESNNLKKEYYDIRSFKNAAFFGCASQRIPNIGCIADLNISVTWQEAQLACQDVGMELPNINTLISIHNQKNNYTFLPQSGGYWALGDTGAPSYAYYMPFELDIGKWTGHANLKGNKKGALCVGK